MKCRVVVFSLLLVCWALAQESRPVLRGVWGATAGASATFRGRWWAEIEASEAASGSWTLLDDSNRIVLEGTWSARRVNAPADLAGFSGKTFADMLKRRWSSRSQVPGAADALTGTGGFKDQNGKDCVFGLALWNRSFFRAPLESPQKLQYLLFGPAAVVAIGIGQE